MHICIFSLCSLCVYIDWFIMNEKKRAWSKFVNIYNKAFDYSCSLNSNIAIGLKSNKLLCVWKMTNKKDTYKEFMF